MDYIVQPQVPINKIAIVLLSHMWKIHVCIFLEGKYWTTNKDEAINRATMYLVYLGKNVYHDTTWKGSVHWSIMEVPHREYNLCKPQPKSHKSHLFQTQHPLDVKHYLHFELDLWMRRQNELPNMNLID